MAALEALALVLVGGGVVPLGAEAVLVRARRALVQAGAHVHAQRAQAPLRLLVLGEVALAAPPRALQLQRVGVAPHLQRARLHLRAQVQPHVRARAAVRVAAPHAAQRRRPQVQVAVLQQELALGLGARQQRVGAVWIPAVEVTMSVFL